MTRHLVKSEWNRLVKCLPVELPLSLCFLLLNGRCPAMMPPLADPKQSQSVEAGPNWVPGVAPKLTQGAEAQILEHPAIPKVTESLIQEVVAKLTMHLADALHFCYGVSFDGATASAFRSDGQASGAH